MKKYGLLFLWLALFGGLNAQNAESYDVQKCVETALQNNLQLKQLRNNQAVQFQNRLQNVLDFIPSLNGQVDLRVNSGQTFFNGVGFPNDALSSSPALFLSYPLVQIYSKIYTLRQTNSTISALSENYQKASNDLVTNVLATYLAMIQIRGNISILNSRVEVLRKQLERLQKLYNAGTITQLQLLNVESQLAAEKVNLVTLENQLARQELSLAQLMQLDATKKYNFIMPDSSIAQITNEALPALDAVQNAALANMPEIREQTHRIQIADYNIKLAKINLYPTLNLSAGLNTNYYYSFSPFPGQVNESYFKQLDQKFSKSFALTLSVPIFNGWRARNAVAVAKIQKNVAETNAQIAANTLLFQVQQAHQDVALAKARYESINEQLRALDEAFKYAEIQFNAGTLPFINYFETLNNKTRAEAERLNARFDFFFKTKILDVYQGKTPKL